MVKNNRLHHVGYLWAFSSLRSSPGAQARYHHRRDIGDRHAQAQRHLFNRLLRQLFHCLQRRVLFEKERTSAPAQGAVVVAQVRNSVRASVRFPGPYAAWKVFSAIQV